MVLDQDIEVSKDVAAVQRELAGFQYKRQIPLSVVGREVADHLQRREDGVRRARVDWREEISVLDCPVQVLVEGPLLQEVGIRSAAQVHQIVEVGERVLVERNNLLLGVERGEEVEHGSVHLWAVGNESHVLLAVSADLEPEAHQLPLVLIAFGACLVQLNVHVGKIVEELGELHE